ncbi:MAG: long-chain fatty acid--CoA ligase [Candidatus Aminicenantes bacterium]|nr:long-chain fatty acid--CoA ligase [Candidatus Aminicenantes bacterium]
MVKTLGQLFIHTIKSFPKDDLMLYKEAGSYVPISTDEVAKRVKNICLGLRALGLESGDKLIIFSDNRPEWVMTDMANQCLGGVTVPIYPTLVPDQVKYIINNSDAKIVCFSDEELWKKIKEVKNALPNVQHYVTYASEAPEGASTLAEVMRKGEALDKQDSGLFEQIAMAGKPDDVASIIYTSGTTGIPKGVMLTHQNFISNIKSVSTVVEFSEKDTVLSFLPLAHVLERMVTFTYLYRGCSIAYAESIETVGENLIEVKPHIMVSVPRVFEKIYAKVIDNVLASSSLKRKIFFWAVKVGKEYGKRKLEKQPIPKSLERKRGIAEKLVFSKVIEKTGGRVRFFVSGGAPLSKDIADFFYALGLVVLEGYGLTETSPVIALNSFENLKFGTVGKPIPGVDVKIADDGEILSKGPHIMKGYYRMEEETQEAIKNGWFYTGDIGHIDAEGFLVITDRKKDLIVTSGGKNVAPQPIENLLKTNPYISNVVVIGDRRKFISALVIPNFEKIENYAKSKNIAYSSLGELIKNEKIVSFIEAEVNNMTNHLASYEKVKKVRLLEREFEIEQDEITPSLKVKRNVVGEKHKKIIDEMYSD